MPVRGVISGQLGNKMGLRPRSLKRNAASLRIARAEPIVSTPGRTRRDAKILIQYQPIEVDIGLNGRLNRAGFGRSSGTAPGRDGAQPAAFRLCVSNIS